VKVLLQIALVIEANVWKRIRAAVLLPMRAVKTAQTLLVIRVGGRWNGDRCRRQARPKNFSTADKIFSGTHVEKLKMKKGSCFTEGFLFLSRF